MLSAMWLGLMLPVVVPHCDVVAQGLHDLVAHSHGAHPHAKQDHSVADHSADHHETNDHGSDGAPPLDPQCEVANDTGLADAKIGAKVVAKSPIVDDGAGFYIEASFTSLDIAVVGPRAPPRRQHGTPSVPDHFQRNHRLLI
jgi:hypothetical protein